MFNASPPPKPTTTRPSRAYAIRVGNEIDVTTVSPTDRAAKVNWLCTACQVLVTQAADNEFVERRFRQEAETHTAKVECVLVEVSELAILATKGKVSHDPELDGPIMAPERADDRLDGIDRRIEALRLGLNDAHAVIGRHEDKLNSTASGYASMQWSEAAKRLQSLESRLTGVGGVHEAYKRIERLEKCATADHQRIVDLAGRLKEEEKEGQTRDTILEQHGHRLTDIAGMIRRECGEREAQLTELLDRIRKLESQTYEQQKVISAFHPHAKPARKSLGWINFYPRQDETFVTIYKAREDADKASVTGRKACIEVIEGDGL